ncbi:UNVERIFIED_CONTAM: hypothetical protein GTU68_021471 [Idotea baltica]|nr:hypothetical protein [Idotea baltica]
MNGYLSVPLTNVASSSGITEEVAELVLSEVQLFDPIGIAARDLRECLLLQLEYEGLTESLPWKIVFKHLALVEHAKLDEIANKESESLESVIAAVEHIRTLEPRPARPFSDETPHYITPDVYVRRVGEDYVISANDTGMPKLRLNPEYQRLLENKEYSKVEGDYLKEKLKAAAWLIKSVEQRQQTITRVTESIMRYQRQFLEHGVSALKPLILKDIASDVNLHQSTISRITTNKYVHTPQGVYELKFFFSSRLRNDKGDSISSESVRKQIKELIAQEDLSSPFSDQVIANMLAKSGVEIARRTVAKYREGMGILSSSRRKKKY